MKRKVTVLIACLFLAFMTFTASAAQLAALDSLISYTADHFEYKIPVGWYSSENDRTKYFYNSALNDISNGFIMVSEDEIDDISDDTEELVALLYNSYIDSLLSSVSSTKEHYREMISISGYEGRIISFSMPVGTDEHDVCAVILFHEGYSIAIAVVQPALSADILKAYTSKLVSHIKVIKPLPDLSLYKDFIFKTVARKPNAYIGDRVKISGKVRQVLGNASNGFELRVATDGAYDDIVYVVTEGNHNENFLTDDIVELFCSLAGEITYKTVLGSSVTLPLARCEYYIIVK